MKKLVKRILPILAITMSVMLSFSAPSVFAEPETEGESVPTPIVANADTTQGIQTNNTAAQSSTKSSIPTGGIIMLLFAVVIVNAAVSFAISNRFYKMSKKDNHLQAEIRALRRDIDDKFSGNIKELREKSVTVKNTNKSYAKEAITYKETPAEENSEIAKKWNIKITDQTEPEYKMRAERSTAAERSRTRHAREEAISADDGVSDNVKSKARQFLGDIFPFEED